MIWIENGVCASPASKISPSALHTAIPNWLGGTSASARDVTGHATLPEQRAYIVENFLQQGVHRRLHRS